jgi:small nuclear ribonucleoprotein (snRNP)-like protein
LLGRLQQVDAFLSIQLGNQEENQSSAKPYKVSLKNS